MPNPGSAYRAAQLRARAMEGLMTREAAKRITAELTRYANALEAQLIGLPASPTRAAIEATIEAQRVAAAELGRRLDLAIANVRELSFDEVQGVWQRTQLQAGKAAGLSEAQLGAVRYPPITMIGAYERIGGRAHWSTILGGHLSDAAREADVLIREALNTGVAPDVLAQRLRPYVLGSDTLREAFGDLPQIDIAKLSAENPNLMGTLRQVRNNARRIAWSESHNARQEAELTQWAADPLVKYVRWELSPDRGTLSPPDECDGLAENDFFGLGKGIYPLDNVPPAPHPYDRCELIPIVRRSPTTKPTGLQRQLVTPILPRGGKLSKQAGDRIRRNLDDLVGAPPTTSAMQQAIIAADAGRRRKISQRS